MLFVPALLLPPSEIPPVELFDVPVPLLCDNPPLELVVVPLPPVVPPKPELPVLPVPVLPKPPVFVPPLLGEPNAVPPPWFVNCATAG